MSFLTELKRRGVLRVGVAYAVTAWLVIQVVETIFPAFGFGDATVRVVTIVFAVGLVPTLVLAWLFELTPEGLRKEKDLDRSLPPPPDKGKKLDRVIIVVLVLSLVFFAFDYFVLDPRREAALEARGAAAVEQALRRGRAEARAVPGIGKSIAVLAFQDMSPGKDQEYLSDGIAEELLNLLARIPEIRVISRSSAFTYKGKDVRLSEIARELNVSHILEGSVRTAGDRVRVTAQLIDGHSDVHLWSETYDRTLDDIFAIQDEIASEVVQELRIELLGSAPTVRKTDPQAFRLYLRARERGQRFTAEALQESNALYRQVLEIDPQYAPAWANLAVNAINAASLGVFSAEESTARAREAGLRALELDHAQGEVHALMGWIARRENDLAGAARHYKRAMDLNPFHITVLNGSAVLLTALGRLEEALALQKAIVDRNPLNEVARYNFGVTQYRVGLLQESIETQQAILKSNPARSISHYSLGVAMLLAGDAQGALQAFEQEPSEIWRTLGLPMAYHALGRQSESDASLAELVEKHGREAAYNIAYVYAFRGEADLAFEWLETELAVVGPAMPTIVSEPMFANIHSDPRWSAFLERIGKAPEQLAKIEFNVTLPE